MQDLYPWSSIAAVERVLSQTDEDAVAAWLSEHWDPSFFAADPAVAKRLLPFIDLPHCRWRAQTVLFAVERDWPWVLDKADDPACGFTPAFWRDAFMRAQEAGSARCIAWVLDANAEIVASVRGGGLEL
jgi:hypothetical protein